MPNDLNKYVRLLPCFEYAEREIDIGSRYEQRPYFISIQIEINCEDYFESIRLLARVSVANYGPKEAHNTKTNKKEHLNINVCDPFPEMEKYTCKAVFPR